MLIKISFNHFYMKIVENIEILSSGNFFSFTITNVNRKIFLTYDFQSSELPLYRYITILTDILFRNRYQRSHISRPCVRQYIFNSYWLLFDVR